MANTKAARLLPPLHHIFADSHRAGDAKKPLDLRDDAGNRIIAGRRGMGRHPVDETVLREEVSNNLAVLLNTVHLAATEDLGPVPEVARSILNFGMPDLASYTIDDTRVDDIAQEIRAAMIRFEPRVDPHSVKAVRDANANAAALELRFIVYAELFAEPLNIPVEYVAEVDTELAKFRIERR